ncbi:hypothetical protein GGF46_001969 [Coemansia sp. RSA 552]|nr:hypothetical protein GGF46_001969 [Coemansia sp. RSA 552]
MDGRRPHPSPQPLAPRNASVVGLPSRSPDAHRRMLQRTQSLGAPGSPLWPPVASPPPQTATPYRFSPRRKRLPLLDSPVSPRRMRRRLFFSDASDEPTAPEDCERRRAQHREAAEMALAVIREAVEAGDAHVDLSDLELEAVPDELAELKDLVVLTPSHALITALQLTLSNNILRHFPLAVCELTNLTTLILSHNRIALLPPEIGNLVNLSELSVAHNRLRYLPLELTRLKHLHTLSVFPNPFLDAPDAPEPAGPEVMLRRRLQAELPGATLRPFRLTLVDRGLPRLADLAARKLAPEQRIALKQRLAQCLENTRPVLGRIIGPAIEPGSGAGVLSALKAQHLVLPIGHLCAHCAQWFLAPPVELTAWAPLSILARPAPFKVRLCGRTCLFSGTVARILAPPP